MLPKGLIAAELRYNIRKKHEIDSSWKRRHLFFALSLPEHINNFHTVHVAVLDLVSVGCRSRSVTLDDVRIYQLFVVYFNVRVFFFFAGLAYFFVQLFMQKRRALTRLSGERASSFISHVVPYQAFMHDVMYVFFLRTSTYNYLLSKKYAHSPPTAVVVRSSSKSSARATVLFRFYLDERTHDGETRRHRSLLCSYSAPPLLVFTH